MFLNYELYVGERSATSQQSASQERKHCEDAAVVVHGRRESELLEDSLHVPLDRPRAQV
jgi:hypothetical protein